MTTPDLALADRRSRARAPRRSWLLGVGHAGAGLIVLAGVVAQVARPLAPDFGPVLDPATWFEPSHLELVEGYRAPRSAVSAVALAVRVAVPLLLVLTARGRRVVDAVVARAGPRPALAATAVVLGAVVATDLMLGPLAFWAGYVHEGAFGFRTHGFGGWAYDWAIARVPGWIAVAVLVALGYALARRLPRAWPPVAALGGVALAAAVVFVAPLVLEPLAHRTVPLPPGDVRTEVERVLAAAGEDVEEILVADASRRTTKVNAYVSGLGATRRVVLYDNLVETRPPAEVGLILAHELGHRQGADVARGLAAGAAGLVALVYVLAWVSRRRAASGREQGAADPRGAAVVLAVVVVLAAASLPLQMAVSRRAEAAADFAALEITQDARSFLAAKEQLARANLADPSPPWWAYLLWYTHPTAAERLTMGERWGDRSN